MSVESSTKRPVLASMSINFQPLDVLVSNKTLAFIKELTRNPRLARKSFIRHNIRVVLAASALIIIYFLAETNVIALLFFVIVIIAMLINWSRRITRESAAIQHFVRANGWKFDKAPEVNIVGLSPSVRKSYPISEAVCGEFAGLPFYLYGFHSELENFRYEQNSLVLSIRLLADLPLVILDGHANNFIGSRLLNPPARLGMKKLSLEGDFDQYFQLFMVPNEQIDALSLITPELMEELVRGGSMFDIEIHGHYAHVICTFTHEIDAVYTKPLLKFGQKFAAHLADKMLTFTSSAEVATS
jgi:hypothetical protein